MVDIIVCSHDTVCPSNRLELSPLWSTTLGIYPSLPCKTAILFLVWCGCDTSYIVSVHIQCQASIYTLSLCRRHSWRVRLAKQETLTPPGHLVSPLVCRGLWMSTVELYYWCHSDSASVLLYFTSFYDVFTLYSSLFSLKVQITECFK